MKITVSLFIALFAVRIAVAAPQWSQPLPAGTGTSIAADFKVNHVTPAVGDGTGIWVLANWNFKASPRTFSGYWTRSGDSGASWSNLAPYASGFYPKALATDRRGVWMMAGPVWDSVNEIRLTRSVDNGQTWTAPVAVVSDSMSPDEPNIATNGSGTWVMTWQIDEGAIIYAATSVDNGQTWSARVALGTSQLLYGASISYTGNGVWLASWGLSSTPGILISKSTNNGATWTQPQSVTQPPANGNDRQPDLECDGSGKCVATFVRYDGLQSRPQVISSLDSGQTWSSAVPLTGTLAPSQSFSPPSVETNGRGEWTAAFAGGAVAYSCYSTDGSSWSQPLPMFTNPAGFTPQSIEIGTDGIGNWIATFANSGTAQPTHPWFSRAMSAPQSSVADWQIFQ